MSPTVLLDRASAIAALGGRYLVFRIGHEAYGIDFAKVREIVPLTPVVPVLWLAPVFRGVVKVRQELIPTVDLRRRFGNDWRRDPATACIVVTMVTAADGRLLPLGLIVDQIHEVVAIAPHAIEPTPEFRASPETAFVLGLTQCEGDPLMLLDAECLVDRDELTRIVRLLPAPRPARRAAPKSLADADATRAAAAAVN